MIDTDSHVIVTTSAGTHGFLVGSGARVDDKTSWFAWIIPYDVTVGYDITARSPVFGMYVGMFGFSRHDRSRRIDDSASFGFQSRSNRGRSTFGPGFELGHTWELTGRTEAATCTGDLKESSHSLGLAVTGDFNLFVPERERDGRMTVGLGPRYLYWRSSDSDLFGCPVPD